MMQCAMQVMFRCMQYYNTLKLKLQRGKGIAGSADNRCNVQCLQWKVPLYNAHSILQYCKVLLKEVALQGLLTTGAMCNVYILENTMLYCKLQRGKVELQGLLTTGAICNVLQSIAQRGKGIAMCNVYISKYHKVQLLYCKLQRGNVELQGLLTTDAMCNVNNFLMFRCVQYVLAEIAKSQRNCRVC